MVERYRKKPVEVDVIKWDGINTEEVCKFVESGNTVKFKKDGNKYGLFIVTLEGEMRVKEGDYIIRGVHGEYYPCDPDIFNKTYEKVEI